MSEAAKPADPERALAALEHFWLRACQEMDLRAAGKPNRLPAAAIEMGEASATAWGWLLPLARAGLRCEMDAGVHPRRDALRAEFAALVSAASETLRCIESTTRQPYGLLHENDLNAARLRKALAGEIAAAVLRSPEPAAKEMP